MSTVAVYSYTHSVTYVADNILKSLKDIIVLSGLDPNKLTSDWKVLLAGISRWIDSGHLEMVTLQIYDPTTDKLIKRWDIGISYTWVMDAGTFWTDTDQLRYAIKKEGLLPSQVSYDVIVSNKAGRPDVNGWTAGNYRSTDGMVRQSLGATIDHSGLSANTSYWRKV